MPDLPAGPGLPNSVELVAGAHRLAAAREAGWSTIPAQLVAVDRRQARIMEIDENLMRRELSALDRGIFLAERKAVWEALHPETKKGVKGAKAKHNSATDMLSFAESVAQRTGLSARTVRRAVALIDGLASEAVDLLRLTTMADNAAQLRSMARLDRDLQVRIAREIADGRARSIRDVVAPASKAAPDDFETLMKAWSRAGAKARRRFLATIGATQRKGQGDGEAARHEPATANE